MTTNSPNYTRVAMILHWLIAAALIFQIVLGLRMGEANSPSTYAIFQMHKSIGITILVLSVARLIWRLTHRAPSHDDLPRLERLAAHLTHIAFYAIMIGMPITGWILVSASRINIPTVLYSTVPWPHIPFIASLELPQKAMWEQWSTLGHEALAYLAYGLIALHIGAVIKHQWFDKQPILARMTGKGQAGLKEPRLWIALGALLVVVGAGYLYAPATQQTQAQEPTGEMLEDVALSLVEAEQPAPVEETASSVEDLEEKSEKPEPQPLSDWTIQKSNASLGFTTTWSGEAIQGQFGNWSGQIRFSPDLLDQTQISITIDTKSASTGDAQRDSTLPGTEFFDTSSHPTASFTASKVRKTGEGRYIADGRLTIKGSSHPLQLPFRLTIEGDTARASGTVNLDRTLFGVGQGMYADTDSIPALVRVNFSFTATR